MPQSNGQAERMITTIKTSLDTSDPTTSLDDIISAYDYTPSAVLENRTPAEVFFGRRVRTPFDVVKPRRRTFPMYTPYQRYFRGHQDRRHGTRARPFVRGEMVTVELSNGNRVPARIVRFRGTSMVEVEVQGKLPVRHRNQVWKLHAAAQLDDNLQGSKTPGPSP